MFSMNAYQKRYILTSLLLALGAGSLSSCRLFGCEKFEKYEVQIRGMDASVRAFGANDQPVYRGTNDTLHVDSVARWWVVFDADRRTTVMEQGSWHFFSEAKACEPPGNLEFTQQQLRAFRIVALQPLPPVYPNAGGDVSNLFVVDKNQNTYTSSSAFFQANGLTDLLNYDKMVRFDFIGAPAPGSITQFEAKFVVDADTFRCRTPFIRF